MSGIQINDFCAITIVGRCAPGPPFEKRASSRLIVNYHARNDNNNNNIFCIKIHDQIINRRL